MDWPSFSGKVKLTSVRLPRSAVIPVPLERYSHLGHSNI